jgi:signal transduction histidine kinase
VEIKEEPIDGASGERHTLRTLKAPITNERGEVEYLVGIINDITAQKQLEGARLDFIRVAAHELRTPLTSLKLGFDFLARETRGALNQEQQRSLDVLSISIERLSRLARNLLDLASMDAGLLALSYQEVDVRSLMEEAVAVFEGHMKENGLTWSIETEPELKPAVGDPSRLSQVLFNLVSNAVKYTPSGGVKLSARNLDGNYVEVCVSDTGIGIAPAHREAIFSRFVKSPGTDGAGEGTGLGLSITKVIVEAHGGRIWVESPGFDPEKCPGSHFHILLPVRSAWASFQDK